METKQNLYSKINEIRALLLGDLSKSGKNNYSKYDYFQLSDFMPLIIKYCNEKGVYTKFWISKDKVELPSTNVETVDENNNTIKTSQVNFQYVENAHLLLINLDDTDDQEEFIKETATVAVSGAQPIQNLGGKSTYMKRYMYMDAFEITDNDFVEENTGKPETEKVKAPKKAPVKEVTTTNVVNDAVVPEMTIEETVVNEEKTLMSMKTKVELANYMKEKGLNPATEIVECAKKIGVDVPFLEEKHAEVIKSMIESK